MLKLLELSSEATIDYVKGGNTDSSEGRLRKRRFCDLLLLGEFL